MDNKDLKISLARIYYPVKVLGPGNRVGIWMNGCMRRCDGCISPEMQEYDRQKEISVGAVIGMVKSIPEPIDGFTISGGEPFYQPEPLNMLIDSLLMINDDILIFTGYTLEELKSMNKKAINSTLDKCAAIIDGPYIRKLNDNHGMRGSSNQRCHIFKYHDKYADVGNAERRLQTIIYGGRVLTIGIPQGEVL